MGEFDIKEFERKKAEVKKEWSRLYTEKGNLLYEGMVYNDKPCGAGTVYFENGNVYQEGVFGIKGLSSGREYYPDSVTIIGSSAFAYLQQFKKHRDS